MGKQPDKDNWTTRMPEEECRRYGVTEAHVTVFQPMDDKAGKAPAMAFMIPETPRVEVIQGLALARRNRARVAFLCDTAEQAEDMAKLALAKLPKHRRISLERAADGGWGLSG